MKGTRFLKPACWLLCAMMLIGQLTVLASAADGSTGSSTTSSSLADIKEMLNAASYEEYRAKHADAKRATQTVEVDVCGEGAYTVKGDGFKTVEHDGVTGLYTPNTGSVTWTVEVPEDGLYAITEKGLRNSRICESSLPYSVRLRTDKNVAEYNRLLLRKNQVQSRVAAQENGSYLVELRLQDDVDSILHLELTAATEAMARDLADRFRKDPEGIYTRLLSALYPPAE